MKPGNHEHTVELAKQVKEDLLVRFGYGLTDERVIEILSSDDAKNNSLSVDGWTEWIVNNYII